ncbi:MAG: hypothetical protein JKY15_06095 [Deltaproteobacteria bacterium]|nr:hypothetical protein [Deltaproteobacteria bacterium]
MTKHPVARVKFSSPVGYDGNLFWLILFLIIWLPLGLVLFLKNGYIKHKSSRFSIYYRGDWNWLYFWAILCFPVAIALLVFKGVDVLEETY